jgi:hypothetical protein
LLSTIAGTFTTGINLFDRVNDKRKEAKQQKLDETQDEKIKKLEQRVNQNESRFRQGNGQGQAGADDVRQSLEYGGPRLQREYDRNFMRLGDRFAEGDCTWNFLPRFGAVSLPG